MEYMEIIDEENMDKMDLFWHQDDEFEVLSDKSGWKLIFVMNHYKNKFRYEVEQPNGEHITGLYLNAYDALDAYKYWKYWRTKEEKN